MINVQHDQHASWKTTKRQNAYENSMALFKLQYGTAAVSLNIKQIFIY